MTKRLILLMALLAAMISAASWTQQGGKMTATGLGTSFGLGYGVSLSADGNTAVVGASDANSESGGIFIFIRTGTTWTQQAGPLIATGGGTNASQGFSNAISADGNTVIVGAPQDSSVANQLGAAFVWTRSGTTWTQQGGKLLGTGYTSANQMQGYAVALSSDGNTAVVGSPFDGASPASAGAAWVFTRSGSTWTQQGNKLVASDATVNMRLGGAVAISGDSNTLILGSVNNHGVAYVFTRSAGVWTQQGASSISGTSQGNSASLSYNGNTAVLGDCNYSSQKGATWVWTRVGSTWTQQAGPLTATDATVTAGQGVSVSLSRNGTTFVTGGNTNSSYVGASWVWSLVAGTWTQQGTKLVGTPSAGTPVQGTSVGMSGDGLTFMVGGPQDPGARTKDGAVWVFTTPAIATSWVQQGTKLVGTGNVGTTVYQGYSVATTYDGNTAVVGGSQDEASAGAAWVWNRNGSTWTQTGPKLRGGGVISNGQQGSSVAVSSDGTTVAVGGPGDNSGVGAAWVYGKNTSATSLIAGASNNYLFTSPTGTAWTYRVGPFPSNNLNGVVYGNGLWVAASNGVGLASSPDGITWTTRLSANNLYSLAYGNATFVAVGFSGKIYTSPDGITWTLRTSPFGTGYLRCLTYANGMFVAGGSDGSSNMLLAKSTDGITWTATSYATTLGTYVQSVAFGNGLWLVTDGAPSVQTSPDLVTWTPRTTGIGSNQQTAPVYGAGMWVIVNQNGYTATSPDGVTWTAHFTNLFGTGDVVDQIAYTGSLFVAVGANTKISTSPDGLTWTAATGTGYTNTIYSVAAAPAPGTWLQQSPKLVGTGYVGSSTQGTAVALSSDGNTLLVGANSDQSANSHGAVWVYTRSAGVWAQQGAKLFAADELGTGAAQGTSVAISADGNTALIGGTYDNQGIGAVWAWTRSGSTWTKQQKMIMTGTTGTSVGVGASVAISADGNTALIGAPYNNTFAGAVWVWTRSGSTWTQQAGPLVGSGASGSSSRQGNSVALSVDGSIAVVAGRGDSASAGAIWIWTRSGTTWTQQGTKLSGTGFVGTTAQQGFWVTMSGDGSTFLEGAAGDNSYQGAVWPFVSLVPSPSNTVRIILVN
jgi:hypothetical protein